MGLLCSTRKQISFMQNEQALSPGIRKLVKSALAEDAGAGDATTNSIIPENATLRARLISRESGVVAGLAIAELTFRLLDSDVGFHAGASDGDRITKGQTLAAINGNARAILTAERTALNFLSRMSGIATMTREFVTAIGGARAKILDTRKTAPSLRIFDKMAVRIGGGDNHRMGLFDMILIKDNHIDLAGSITEAVMRARAAQTGLEIEVEARTLEDVSECLQVGVNRIMLDNMTFGEMREAVQLVNGRAKVEASGNVTLDNVRTIAETGVDYISVGALTHSAPALDVSLVVY